MNRTPGLLATALLLTGFTSPPARAQCPLPDPNLSYYVPQSGPVASPSEGLTAYRLFRRCPNNDGGASLPNSARIKVVLLDGAGAPLVGVPQDQIYLLFNGGTTVQGFSGIGADSIIANGTWNVTPLCPDVREVKADAATDASGATYVTFTGAVASSPGVGVRDANLKWGHWDTEIPVYVGKPPCNPIALKGRATSIGTPGSYTLRVKDVDVVGGLGAVLNQGETVTVTDYNVCFNCIATPTGPFCYWCDFDYSSGVSVTDMNILTAHLLHDCDTPLSP